MHRLLNYMCSICRIRTDRKGYRDTDGGGAGRGEMARQRDGPMAKDSVWELRAVDSTKVYGFALLFVFVSLMLRGHRQEPTQTFKW